MSSVLGDVHWQEKRAKEIIRLADMGIKPRKIADRYCMTPGAVKSIVRRANFRRNKPEKTK